MIELDIVFLLVMIIIDRVLCLLLLSIDELNIFYFFKGFFSFCRRV